MNKDDIIKVIVMHSNKAVAMLAWDDSKNEAFFARDTLDIIDAKKAAIGALWQEYGDEIIEHISNKDKE